MYFFPAKYRVKQLCIWSSSKKCCKLSICIAVCPSPFVYRNGNWLGNLWALTTCVHTTSLSLFAVQVCVVPLNSPSVFCSCSLPHTAILIVWSQIYEFMYTCPWLTYHTTRQCMIVLPNPILSAVKLSQWVSFKLIKLCSPQECIRKDYALLSPIAIKFFLSFWSILWVKSGREHESFLFVCYRERSPPAEQTDSAPAPIVYADPNTIPREELPSGDVYTMPDKGKKKHKPEDHLPTYQVVTSLWHVITYLSRQEVVLDLLTAFCNLLVKVWEVSHMSDI